MNQTLMLMKLNDNGASTQEKIIHLLADKWPLTTKEMHREIVAGGEDISYQAIHKALNALNDANALAKNGNTFQLSKEWLSGMKNYFSGIEEKYYGTSGKYEFEPGKEETIWKFTDYSVMVVTLAKLFMSKKLVGKADSRGLGILRHGLFPLDFSFYDFDLLFKMIANSKGGYVLIESDTPFDQWISSQYIKARFDGAKCGIKELNLKKDIIIHGEHFVEVTYHEETAQFLDKFYAETKGIEGLYQNFLKNKTHNKLDITVKITRNPELAQFMKSQMVEKYFGGGKK